MTYDNEVTELALGNAKSTNAQNRLEALRAIPDGTLKINGRFVKVEPWDPRYQSWKPGVVFCLAEVSS